MQLLFLFLMVQVTNYEPRWILMDRMSPIREIMRDYERVGFWENPDPYLSPLLGVVLILYVALQLGPVCMILFYLLVIFSLIWVKENFSMVHLSQNIYTESLFMWFDIFLYIRDLFSLFWIAVLLSYKPTVTTNVI